MQLLNINQISPLPPTRIEELTAGSDKKKKHSTPPPPPFLLFLFSSDPAVSSSIFVGEKGQNLMRNDPDKSELLISFYLPEQVIPSPDRPGEHKH